jgi:hypothetical protein
MERTVKQQDAKIGDLENLILEKDRMYQMLVEEGKQLREEWEKVMTCHFIDGYLQNDESYDTAYNCNIQSSPHIDILKRTAMLQEVG